MRVLTKKTEEEIRREFFGPIQEASRKPYMLDVDPRKSWCELSELRLSTLICEFKPVGINRHFHMIAIIERMGKIFDNENPQAEIFLNEHNKVAFRQQQQDLLMGGRPERASYPPKYMCRPSLEMIEEKLNKCNVSDFELPEYIMVEVRQLAEERKRAELAAGNTAAQPQEESANSG